MARVARQRLGTEPRSALGAPLILANKDPLGGRLVIQIVKRHGNLQETPVLIDDGMIDESWQEWHDNIQVQILDRFWALPLILPTRTCKEVIL